MFALGNLRAPLEPRRRAASQQRNGKANSQRDTADVTTFQRVSGLVVRSVEVDARAVTVL
jgi:hypothetical protein